MRSQTKPHGDVWALSIRAFNQQKNLFHFTRTYFEGFSETRRINGHNTQKRGMGFTTTKTLISLLFPAALFIKKQLLYEEADKTIN